MDRKQRIDRPHMAKGYGISDDPSQGMLTWEWARARLEASRNYWVATVRADGRAHAMPVWGVWLDDELWFGTDPDSVKGRNLARRADCVMHLESGDDVVILEGSARVNADPGTMRRVCDAYEAKYTFRPNESDAFRVFAPTRVLLWREQDFPTSATRITFG